MIDLLLRLSFRIWGMMLGILFGEQPQQDVVPILVARRIALALCKQPPIKLDVCVGRLVAYHGSGVATLYEQYCSPTPAYFSATPKSVAAIP
jgi:hypothetical protein